MMERKRECRELHEICSRLGNLGRRLRFPVYLGKELLETPIEELELSVRSFNCLRRAGMATVGDLVQNIDTREDLLKIQAAGYLRYLKILIVELDGVQSDLKEIQIRHAAEHLADLVFRISSLAL